jgi:hypothetical protein
MVAIYVQRDWLKTIGETAKLLFVMEHEGEYIALLAGKVEMDYPFVDAQVVRSKRTEYDDAFLTALIPSHLVSGIFDLTVAEAKQYGFTPPKEPKKQPSGK